MGRFNPFDPETEEMIKRQLLEKQRQLNSVEPEQDSSLNLEAARQFEDSFKNQPGIGEKIKNLPFLGKIFGK
jgi:hypothetical protein